MKNAPTIRIRSACKYAIASLIWAALVMCDAHGGIQGSPDAIAISREAQRLQLAGDFDQAVAALQQGLDSCPGRECRLHLDFALGFISAREASRDPARASELLARAVVAYRRVLDEVPGHVDTVNNLYLVYLAQYEDDLAAQLVTSAMNEDRSGRLAMVSGQIQLERGQAAGALSAFELAAKQRPDDEAPRRGQAMAHRALLPQGGTRLQQRLIEWGSRFPEAAEIGYRALLEKVGPNDKDLVNRTFPQWLIVLSRNGWLSQQRVEQLALNAKQRDDLLAFLKRPTSIPAGASWWMSSVVCRDSLATAGFALGKQTQADGQLAEAVARWETALKIAPRHDEYIYGPLRDSPWTRIDLERELALVYTRHAEFDTGSKFDRVLEDLYEGKGGALGARDLEAIQRYHATLGLILAERKVWYSNVPWRDAMYQLKAAIDTAAKRQTEQKVAYQPLAEIKAALAAGNEALNDRSSAVRAYLLAAEAYMDMDQLEHAQAMLASANRIQSSSPDGADVRAALETILQRRLELEQGELKSESQFDLLLSLCDANWLPAFNLRGKFFAEDFLARQRFKFAADLAARREAVGQDGQNCARAALDQAISSIVSLVGTADIIRLEQSQRLAIRDIDVDLSSGWILSGTGTPPSTEKMWPVYVSSDAYSAPIRINADVIIANNIARRLAPLKLEEVLLGVNKGVVRIGNPIMSTTKLTKIRDEILQLKGVTDVFVVDY